MNGIKHEKRDTGLVSFVKVYFPAGHQLKQENHLSMQNVLVFYESHETIGVKYPEGYWISVLFENCQGSLKQFIRTEYKPTNAKAYEHN